MCVCVVVCVCVCVCGGFVCLFITKKSITNKNTTKNKQTPPKKIFTPAAKKTIKSGC